MLPFSHIRCWNQVPGARNMYKITVNTAAIIRSRSNFHLSPEIIKCKSIQYLVKEKTPRKTFSCWHNYGYFLYLRQIRTKLIAKLIVVLQFSL